MITLPASQYLIPEQIVERICVSCDDDNTDDFRDTFKLVRVLSLTSSPINVIKNVISEISNLEDNWDGYGAVALSEDVYNNTLKFIESLNTEEFLSKIEKEDITMTPYGNIVFDFNSSKGLVSVEIGHRQIGFFTEFINHQDSSSDGISTDFCSIPKELKDALELLYA